ncbi:MAG: acyl-CoA dehydrogenase family protein [Phenylobacterium sp.]|jgi:alkylation response protein AidB-like acyl-CoA dehydrogenase|uniref:acyl-CoA dehydrogenase family protein n=1 Tax=Phenylobacterium sp. TaxID=1871053 RepID=UPI002A35FBE0|nr:acyl-CoA dehydrogenase family protein [Phenylobacterium sp.]MDX9997515.1 acyl-CoA dehydrogenase family protein [Phenylobacterium sp.]
MAVLSEEQSMLRDAAKSWVQEKSPVTAFRKMRDSGVELGYDANAWNEMAEMGWAGVIIPEDFGGSNFGYLSMGLILEELGRTLTASPLLASGLGAASALVLGGSDEQKSNWLPKIASGEVVGALAVDEGAHHAPEKVALKAEKSGDGYTLNGTKSFVLEGLAANLYIVSARTSGNPGDTKGITLFVVPADAAGISKKRLSLADSRGAANVTFDNVKVGADAVLGEVDNGYPLLEKVLDRARAGLAAEMLGSANQAFETTLEYLKTRVQFGQVIGSFQALQHRAAKMFTDLELARSAVEAALQAIDNDTPDVPELVSLAKAKMGDTFHLISNEMVQMHGGIGMTDAHEAGFYLKRARAAEAAFGNQAYHRDRYARIQGY